MFLYTAFLYLNNVFHLSSFDGYPIIIAIGFRISCVFNRVFNFAVSSQVFSFVIFETTLFKVYTICLYQYSQ